MIFNIEISKAADDDLRNIVEYIAFELQSPESGIRQLERLEKRIAGLNEMPERFHRYEKEPWFSRGLRLMTVDQYYVLYIPDKENALVTIIRVMYSGRDIDAELK
jgi:toxin ParE1/3/4